MWPTGRALEFAYKLFSEPVRIPISDLGAIDGAWVLEESDFVVDYLSRQLSRE